MKNKAIFFDRDGVVNYRIVGDYVRLSDEFRFIPDFMPFFKEIKSLDYLAIIITNQQGIGKGLMTEFELQQVHESMQKELLSQTGSVFDDIFWCPDLSGSGSYRRKPNPGMLLEAVEKWDIDVTKSWMIGDGKFDILAGKNAGVKTIFLRPSFSMDNFDADIVVPSLSGLAEIL